MYIYVYMYMFLSINTTFNKTNGLEQKQKTLQYSIRKKATEFNHLLAPSL